MHSFIHIMYEVQLLQQSQTAQLPLREPSSLCVCNWCEYAYGPFYMLHFSIYPPPFFFSFPLSGWDAGVSSYWSSFSFFLFVMLCFLIISFFSLLLLLLLLILIFLEGLRQGLAYQQLRYSKHARQMSVCNYVFLFLPSPFPFFFLLYVHACMGGCVFSVVFVCLRFFFFLIFFL